MHYLNNLKAVFELPKGVKLISINYQMANYMVAYCKCVLRQIYWNT